MVTSYYIMKMNKNKKHFDTYDYFNNLNKIPISKGIFNYSNSKCRVCFKHGTVSIVDDENASEIIQSLKIFGNIELNEGEGYSKCLCNVCYRFMNSAIMFRKIAKRTNDIIKQQINTSINFENECDNTFNDKNSENFVDKLEEDLIKSNRGKNKSNTLVPCEICKKLIKHSYYKTHITIHDPNHEKYVCDICGKTFRLGPGYYNHRLRHRTDFPFKCKLCPFKGKYLDRLKSHMRTHSGEYRYMCTECPARFVFKSNFNRHVLLKHSDPQHRCLGCEKVFHTEVELQRHNDVVHLGLKNHICNLCGKAFGYRSAMHKHQRRLHKRENMRFHFNPLNTNNNNNAN